MTISAPEEHRKKTDDNTGRQAPKKAGRFIRWISCARLRTCAHMHASAHAHTCTHARLRSIPMVENGRRIFRKTSGYNALCSFQNVYCRIRRSFFAIRWIPCARTHRRIMRTHVRTRTRTHAHRRTHAGARTGAHMRTHTHAHAHARGTGYQAISAPAPWNLYLVLLFGFFPTA